MVERETEKQFISLYSAQKSSHEILPRIEVYSLDILNYTYLILGNLAMSVIFISNRMRSSWQNHRCRDFDSL